MNLCAKAKLFRVSLEALQVSDNYTRYNLRRETPHIILECTVDLACGAMERSSHRQDYVNSALAKASDHRVPVKQLVNCVR